MAHSYAMQCPHVCAVLVLSCACPAGAEQKFIKYVLAFFAGSDGIVLENLAVRFMQGAQAADSAGSKQCMHLPAAACVACEEPSQHSTTEAAHNSAAASDVVAEGGRLAAQEGRL